jgi:hypothetical protein
MRPLLVVVLWRVACQASSKLVGYFILGSPYSSLGFFLPRLLLHMLHYSCQAKRAVVIWLEWSYHSAHQRLNE